MEKIYNLTAKARKPAALGDSVTEALNEIRFMRQEIKQLHKDLSDIKKSLAYDDDKPSDSQQHPSVNSHIALKARKREFDSIAKEVEVWARKLLFDQKGEVEGWTEVTCSRAIRSTFNPNGRTTTFLKWLPDSRGSKAVVDDNQLYPCVKVFATLDAPVDVVSMYLSQERHMAEYNDLIVGLKDLELVSPHSKICLCETPQVLFVKPRKLVTFCHHRWLRDGTQVVVNQACDFKDTKPTAFAIRGATFVSPDPDNPDKTRLSILLHGNPGDDIPKWARKAAVAAAVPSETCKLVHRINVGITTRRDELEESLHHTALDTSSQGRTTRPAGLAQMGFACFWPNGGGIVESTNSSTGSEENASDDQQEAPLAFRRTVPLDNQPDCE